MLPSILIAVFPTIISMPSAGISSRNWNSLNKTSGRRWMLSLSALNSRQASAPMRHRPRMSSPRDNASFACNPDGKTSLTSRQISRPSTRNKTGPHARCRRPLHQAREKRQVRPSCHLQTQPTRYLANVSDYAFRLLAYLSWHRPGPIIFTSSIGKGYSSIVI